MGVWFFQSGKAPYGMYIHRPVCEDHAVPPDDGPLRLEELPERVTAQRRAERKRVAEAKESLASDQLRLNVDG